MTTVTQIYQHDANRRITSENLLRARFLVRHGLCVSNVTWPMDNYSDDIDVLTDLGVKQAKNVCRFFAQFNNRYQVISSSLNRAIQTANIICGELGETALLTPDYRLIEKNHEEPYSDFRSRIIGFVSERLVAEGPYIIVAHGHLIETLLLEFMGAPYQLAERSDGTIGLTGLWGVANGSVSAFIDDKFVMFNHVP